MPYTSLSLFYMPAFPYKEKEKTPATALLFRRVNYSKKKAPRILANQQRFVALTAYLTANSLKNMFHIYLILKPDKRIAPFSH